MKNRLNKYILSIVFLTLIVTSNTSFAHHYKGLPHYNYFDNYPQVPILEFIEEGEEYTVFITVYNFQGLDIDMVDAPNDVRFYIYLYNITTDKSYIGDAAFNIYSHGKIIKRYINIKQEEERIYSIRAEIFEQDDLILEAIIKDENNKVIKLKAPIEIKDSFIDKYGLYLAVLAFFIIVAIIKKVSTKKSDGTTTNTPN